MRWLRCFRRALWSRDEEMVRARARLADAGQRNRLETADAVRRHFDRAEAMLRSTNPLEALVARMSGDRP